MLFGYHHSHLFLVSFRFYSMFSSVQSLSNVWLYVTPWTAARQASLSITNSQTLLKLMSNKLVMPSNHLILCQPLLLPPSIFPSIRVFSNESLLCIRWPKFWSFSFSFSPSNEYKHVTYVGLVQTQKTSGALLPIKLQKGFTYKLWGLVSH